jgi:hypothetical protein
MSRCQRLVILPAYEFTARPITRAFLTHRPHANRLLPPVAPRRLSTRPSVTPDLDQSSQGLWSLVTMMCIALIVAAGAALARK